MATQQTQVLGRALLTPGCRIVVRLDDRPAGDDDLFFHASLQPARSRNRELRRLENYRYFLTDPAFLASLQNTLVLVGSVLAITILLGTPLALLLDQPVIGRSIVRLMVIAPFFVMPTVSALVWKNLLMHPVSGLFAWIAKVFGLTADRLVHRGALARRDPDRRLAMAAFATLILLTALQSLDEEQKEAAEMDGAGALSTVHLPHAAASRAADHGGDPDRDDISPDRVCRDLRHQGWRRVEYIWIRASRTGSSRGSCSRTSTSAWSRLPELRHLRLHQKLGPAMATWTVSTRRRQRLRVHAPQGQKYSNGQAVKASDFKVAIIRDFKLKLAGNRVLQQHRRQRVLRGEPDQVLGHLGDHRGRQAPAPSRSS